MAKNNLDNCTDVNYIVDKDTYYADHHIDGAYGKRTNVHQGNGADQAKELGKGAKLDKSRNNHEGSHANKGIELRMRPHIDLHAASVGTLAPHHRGPN